MSLSSPQRHSPVARILSKPFLESKSKQPPSVTVLTPATSEPSSSRVALPPHATVRQNTTSAKRNQLAQILLCFRFQKSADYFFAIHFYDPPSDFCSGDQLLFSGPKTFCVPNITNRASSELLAGRSPLVSPVKTHHPHCQDVCAEAFELLVAASLIMSATA
jgi:hypothetical protein